MNKVDKTTWKDTINDNEFERFIIEVGDSKQSNKFYPQVKLLKWVEKDGITNECNFSVRAIDDETGTFIPHKVGKKIKLVKNKREYHFYDIPKEKEHPEGGYEFEVILKEKPKTNVIEMSIESKGLKFYYQPELEDSEVQEMAEREHITLLEAKRKCRPENVVGSYAVYHESKAGDYSKMGKKNYRAGKAFHIYRPKIIDSVGKEVWGELNIKKGILSVTISQEFLDNAVYPVRHAAGLTFGYETIGEYAKYDSVNKMIGSFFTPSSSGTITNIKHYSSGYSHNFTYDGNLKTIIVEATGKTIISNGVSSPVDMDSKDWYTFTFVTSPTITGNTEYILSIIADTTDERSYFDTGSTGDGIEDSSNSYSSPTNPTDAVDGNKIYSIYATYTAGASAPTVTTQAVTNIDKTTATGNGNITDDGGATATRGMCWNTTGTPTTADSHATNGTGEGAYTVAMTGLTAGTHYYVRAYATNSEGTSYGGEVEFDTTGTISPFPSFKRP